MTKKAFSRKEKLFMFGRRISRNRLRVKNRKLILSKGNDEHCPKCGCKSSERTGNMAEYPQHWEKFLCRRCEFMVAEIDNSPYISCWESPDDFGLTAKDIGLTKNEWDELSND